MEEGPPANDVCSVCHEGFNIPFQANCSHWFCGKCILRLWEHDPALQPCKCPLCRRQITLLVPAGASQRQCNDPEVSAIVGGVERYNRLFGRCDSSLFQRMRDLPFLLRRLLRELMDPQRSLPLLIRARVYFAMLTSIIYIVSPVDIIPEGVVGILGLLDDFIIAFICFLHIAAIYRSVLVHRHGGP